MKSSFTKDQKESRNKSFIEFQNKQSSKSRHGLFSYPISLAVGDVYHVAPSRKTNKEGKVPTGPKSFYAGKGKSGRSDQVLFSKPVYNAIGDPYDEPWKQLKLRSSGTMSKTRNRPFTAGGAVKQTIVSRAIIYFLDI